MRVSLAAGDRERGVFVPTATMLSEGSTCVVRVTGWMEVVAMVKVGGPLDLDGDEMDEASDGIDGSAAARAIAPEPEDEDSRRHSRVRGKTISVRRLSKRELERGRELYPDEGYPKPRTRAECLQGENAERPCPFVSCKHHLYLGVNERNGAIKLNFPHLEVWDMPETCVLDIADRGGVTLEEVGEIMNLTRERIRQLETRGLAKLKALNELAALQDYVE